MFQVGRICMVVDAKKCIDPLVDKLLCCWYSLGMVVGRTVRMVIFRVVVQYLAELGHLYLCSCLSYLFHLYLYSKVSLEMQVFQLGFCSGRHYGFIPLRFQAVDRLEDRLLDFQQLHFLRSYISMSSENYLISLACIYIY